MTNRTEAVREILLEGACTSVEVAVSLQITRRQARIALWTLKNHQQVETKGKLRTPRGRPLKIYHLTGRGRFAAKADRLRREAA